MTVEDWLVAQIQEAGLPAPVCGFRLTMAEQCRFALAWPDRRLAVEVEGSQTGRAKAAACRAQNRALREGWLVLRFTPGMIEQGEALPAIAEALGSPGVGSVLPASPDFWRDIWTCASCGRDCSRTAPDVAAKRESGLCSRCLAECLSGERCFKCLGMPCTCEPAQASPAAAQAEGEVRP